MANGIPSLLNQANYIANNIALLAADAVQIASLFAPPTWGVYAAGTTTPIFVTSSAASQIAGAITGVANSLGGGLSLGFANPDTIVGFERKREYKISDAPMERGAFNSYNKVQAPYRISLQMAKSGTEASIGTFLAYVENQADSLDLCDIWTPGVIYYDANIQSWDYKRTATDGVGIVTVSLEFIEIRQTVASTYSSSMSSSVQPGTSQTAYQGLTPTGP